MHEKWNICLSRAVVKLSLTNLFLTMQKIIFILIARAVYRFPTSAVPILMQQDSDISFWDSTNSWELLVPELHLAPTVKEMYSQLCLSFGQSVPHTCTLGAELTGILA